MTSAVSYKKLWKLLIDKDMSRADLRRAIGISPATASKLSKGELVSSDVLARICAVLDCDIGDIIEITHARTKCVCAREGGDNSSMNK